MANRAPFRLLNRTVNRGLKALLRSPLHPVASGRLALLSYTGQRSGRRYTIPVSYRHEGDGITVTVAWPDRKVWWRNLTGDGGPVDLLVRGDHLIGHATAIRDEDQDVVVSIELDTHERS